MKITKKRIALCTALLIILSAIPALASDVTGRWTMEGKDPEGNAVTATYVFEQDGAKLTGTVSVPGQTNSIHKGEVDGNKISFAVTMSDATYTLEGAIEGDEIKMTMKSDDPNKEVREVTLKRSK